MFDARMVCVLQDGNVSYSSYIRALHKTNNILQRWWKSYPVKLKSQCPQIWTKQRHKSKNRFCSNFAHRLALASKQTDHSQFPLRELFLGRNSRKTISLRLGSKYTSGYTEFSENLIASRVAQQLLENLSMVFIFSSGLYGMTDVKIK